MRGGRRGEQRGVFGCIDVPTEGGVDVSKVVPEVFDEVCVFLCGEYPRGKLSDLRGKVNETDCSISSVVRTFGVQIKRFLVQIPHV